MKESRPSVASPQEMIAKKRPISTTPSRTVSLPGATYLGPKAKTRVLGSAKDIIAGRNVPGKMVESGVQKMITGNARNVIMKEGMAKSATARKRVEGILRTALRK